MAYTRLALALGLSIVLAQALPWSRASAQNDDAARSASARMLFEEGVGLADQSRWQEAADRFRRALELRDSAVIAYNLASAVVELGRLVEASELYRRVIGDAEAAEDLRASATTALNALEPRLSRVTVHVEGRLESDRVELDERELLAAELDVSVPIDPGDHFVRVRREGNVLTEQAVSIAEGQSQQVSLRVEQPVLPTPREVAVAAPKPEQRPSRTAPNDDRSLTEQWWFWAGIGGVAVGATVVAILLASSGGGERAEPEQGDFDPPVIGVEVAP